MHIGKWFVTSVAAALFFSFQVMAEPWQGSLKSGGVVRVDPLTHKPTLYYNGGSTQLWDGAHELADGSVLLVRDGVAVPDETMFSTWSWQVKPETLDETECCTRLVRKVCGFNNECGDTRGCELARQLKGLEQGDAGDTTVECRQAMADVGLFPTCDKDTGARRTPCSDLVERVCGAKNQCGASLACDLARQLLVMEREERLENTDPDFPTEAGMQCEEAADNSFFKACGG